MDAVWTKVLHRSSLDRLATLGHYKGQIPLAEVTPEAVRLSRKKKQAGVENKLTQQ